MKLKQIILASIILQTTATLPVASALEISLNTAFTNLTTAQNTLSSLLYVEGEDEENENIDNRPSFTYTNSTNIPLIIGVITDTKINTQQLAPNQIYTQKFDATAEVAVQVHADLSPIRQLYNPSVNYSLIVNEQGNLTLSQTGDKKLVNNSGWPMLITATLADEEATKVYKILDINASFTPPTTTNYIMIIPMITNNTKDEAKVKSYSISNNNGQLKIGIPSLNS
jgi:hypothetical protein